VLLAADFLSLFLHLGEFLDLYGSVVNIEIVWQWFMRQVEQGSQSVVAKRLGCIIEYKKK